MREDVLIYTVDGADTITWVSDNWSAFALANGWAGRVPPDRVVGRPLWDFIHGEETRQIYEALFRRVRQGGKPRPIPFRCDAPHEKRFCELVLTAGTAGAIEITSWTRRTEPRPRVPLLDSEAEWGPRVVTICSLCKKIKLSQDLWMEVDEAVAQLEIFGGERVPLLSHGLCPSCYDVFLNQLEPLG